MLTISYPGQDIQTISLNDVLKKAVYTILYFYPKDNTPGCTREAIDFSQKKTDFQLKGVQIIGVSQDSHTSHCSFHQKYDLSVPLISDPEHELHNDIRFMSRGEKNMYGKKYMGTVRNTFLLNNQGQVIKEWRHVSVPQHVQEVRDYVNENLS